MITLDAGSLISSLSTGDYTITRTAIGTYGTAAGTGGVAIPGATSTLTINAAIYQASGRDLERLPEARRSISTIKIFTTTLLYTGAQSGQGGAQGSFQADTISYNGVTHELQTVGTWPGADGFYDCLAQAVG